MKDELNFATTMPGELSVTMDLMLTMPMSSVASLVILIKVIQRVDCSGLKGNIHPTDATPRLAAYFGQGTGSIFKQYLRCAGTESRLIDCPTSSSSCTHSEDAGVTCLPTGEEWCEANIYYWYLLS